MLALAALCALHSILRPSVLPAHLREEGGRQLQQRGPRLVRESVRRIFFQPLHLVSRGEVVQPRVAIFMIGLPGAGKSRIIYDRYERHLSSRRERTTVVVDLGLLCEADASTLFRSVEWCCTLGLKRDTISC